MSTTAVATATVGTTPAGTDSAHRGPAHPSLVRSAVGDILPLAVGVFPFGVVIGVAAAAQGLGPAAATATGVLVYAGTAQLTAITMLAGGASAATALLAVLVINARLLMYGAAMEPLFRRQPRWFRWLGVHFIVDQTFMIATARTDLADPRRFRRYWLTVAAVLTVVWVVANVTGVLLGPVLPADSPLGFAVTSMFIGMLLMKLTTRPALAAAVAGASVAAATAALPHGLGVILGTLAGIVAGTITSRRST
ncbi:MAG TPA: AzlC family ABC transporter permease [Jiangellales bacterium]|nr:AzlC family ABC transporter permease [Jiangellales bacterium]